VNYLNTFSITENDELKFGERLINGQIRRVGSNTLTFGSTGIFEIMSKISRSLNNQGLLDKTQKIKPYLLSFQVNDGNFTGLASFYTAKVENNPSFGIPSYLNALLYKTVGSLSINEDSIDFADTEIGFNRSRSFILENSGEEEIVVNLQIGENEDTFFISNSSITLGEREVFVTTLFFDPTTEEQSASFLVITSGSTAFNIPLTGNGFDRPILDILSSVGNETTINDFIIVDFEITIIDSSPIEEARLVVDGTVASLNSQGPNEYSISWPVSGLSNGTYVLDFEATDILGHTGSVHYVFEVGIYTDSLVEEVFSDTTRNYLIGLIAVVVIVGAIFTRRKIS